MEQRAFDIVLFGATGTLGRAAAEYLSTRAPPGLSVALAGRNATALEALQRTLGPAAQRWGRLTADSTDAQSLERLSRQAHLVVTTVGPYEKYGLPLVEACARNGTDYADISGEVRFMRESINRYDAEAKRTGARIVHACGLDSIPSDLGVLLLQEHLRQAGHSGRLKRVTLLVESMRGPFPPGTLATMLNLFEELARDPGLGRLLDDPYALSPDRAREPELGGERDLSRLAFDNWLGRWTMPWMMESINTRVVRRTNALLGYPYGRAFHYREVQAVPRGLTGLGRLMVGMGMTWGMSALRWGFARRLLSRRLAKPGKERGTRGAPRGDFHLQLAAESEEGMRLSARISAQEDPGIHGTAKMLCESALSLVLDTSVLPERSGVLTPAAALGLPLVERLRAAGMTFEVQALRLPATRPARAGERETRLDEEARAR